MEPEKSRERPRDGLETAGRGEGVERAQNHPKMSGLREGRKRVREGIGQS